MGYSEELDMYRAYWDLRTKVQEVIDAVESGDMNFEGAIDTLREEIG